MARANKICPKPGCPNIARGRYCPAHSRAADKARGTKTERGYGAAFIAMRKAFEPEVDAGYIRCWRCQELIPPGSQWHLGHDDADRAIIRGPEHARCNLSAAGRASHQ